jgi:hypothetical protein
MRKVKSKTKRNLAIPGEPLSQEEFVALIKEAEKGPFKSIDSLVEDVKLAWEKKSKAKVASGDSIPLELESEYTAQIKKAEKGPFYTHSELVEKINGSKKKSKTKLKAQMSPLRDPPSKEELIASIREAEKGPFYELGTFEDFKKKVLSKWNEKRGK